jgi:hypothetical protein
MQFDHKYQVNLDITSMLVASLSDLGKLKEVVKQLAIALVKIQFLGNLDEVLEVMAMGFQFLMMSEILGHEGA